MAIKVGEWNAEWERCKKVFEKVTKEKKPSDTFMKVALKTGLTGKFKAMDKAHEDFSKANSIKDEKKRADARQKHLADLGKAVTDAKKTVTDYLKVLDKAWKDEVKSTGSKVKLDSLNVLEKDLDAIISSADAFYNFASKTEGKRGKELSAALRDIATLLKNLDGTLKKGALFVAQNQRNSNLDEKEAITFFQENVQTVMRDINQNVGNIAKQLPDSAAEKKVGAAMFKALSDWAGQGKSAPDVKAMKSMKDVIELNKKMTARLKAVAEWRKKIKV